MFELSIGRGQSEVNSPDREPHRFGADHSSAFGEMQATTIKDHCSATPAPQLAETIVQQRVALRSGWRRRTASAEAPEVATGGGGAPR
jgi:hypothetical protein